MTAGCLVGSMRLGMDRCHIGGGKCNPFDVFAEPTLACLPLSVPNNGYYKFSLTEENSAKNYTDGENPQENIWFSQLDPSIASRLVNQCCQISITPMWTCLKIFYLPQKLKFTSKCVALGD